MKLYQHKDFQDIIVETTEHLKETGFLHITEQIVEKDYYVTEALRIIAAQTQISTILKGGTSLSKGWGLIHRFSEDIDLFVNPYDDNNSKISNREIDRNLLNLHNAVSTHPGMQIDLEKREQFKAKSLTDFYTYATVLLPINILQTVVKLESGIQSGNQPTESCEIESYVSSFLRSKNLTSIAEDINSFSMILLHYRRTFVEKLFAIHAKVSKASVTNEPLGAQVRHYYDLFKLIQRPEVMSMLRSAEYAQIKYDHDRICREYYSKYYIPLDPLEFKNSIALNPAGILRESIKNEYEKQCSLLCFSSYPSFEDVLDVLTNYRELL